MSDVSQILSAIEQGEPGAAAKLLPPVYQELRKLAAQRLAREAPGLTLQSSDLVHEAYLRLVGEAAQGEWDCRGHFFAAAAEAMRGSWSKTLVARTVTSTAAVTRGSTWRLLLSWRGNQPKTLKPSMRRSASWRRKTRRRPRW